MKYGMSGILQQVRLGQVRKARKSSIIQPPSFPCPFFKIRKKNCQIGSHPGGVKWWKNWLKSQFIRLDQVRKAIQSWKSEARGPPIHLLTFFGQKFERTVFERTTLSHIYWYKLSYWMYWYFLFQNELIKASFYSCNESDGWNGSNKNITTV
jgi:hypothetical protein